LSFALPRALGVPRFVRCLGQALQFPDMLTDGPHHRGKPAGTGFIVGAGKEPSPKEIALCQSGIALVISISPQPLDSEHNRSIIVITWLRRKAGGTEKASGIVVWKQ
jgi:hypothetical protein